jgi:integrase
MTKLAARDALRAEIAKRTGKVADGRILKDGAVTFEWFVRNRYFPLREGDWRPETAREKKAQIEIDLISKFGSERIESIDKFELQTHVNNLAGIYSQDRVKQARSYLKSIFDEAIEQEFLVKDPTRKLKIPKNLRPKDKQILTWEQLRAVLAKAIQSHLRHSRADTTANEYMQELPESVQQMVGTVFAMLTSGEGSKMVN